MADENVIQKIIRLVLDKKSADEAQAQTESVTDKVDAAWKGAAKKIAGYLGVAFLAKKMIDFGVAAVNAARESEAAWSDLEGSIAAAGESFAGMEDRVRAAADAFQASTIHDDDAYAKGLSRLITLSGDVAASTNNMGLVADVAAKFFNGELGPATDLVAKAMNGNTAALSKMGIKAESAQQALEILAQRSMGAAEKKAGTFSGQLAQLNNGWDDFLKDVGNAIIGSEGAGTAMNALRSVVQVLTDWVGRNKDAIANWVTKGVNFAITAADILYRALKGVAEILAGGLQTSLGLAGKAIAFSAKGWVALANAASLFLETIGAKETSDKLDNMAGSLLAQANAIDTWADAAIKAGSSKVQAGIDTLSKVAFSPADFKPGGKNDKSKVPGLVVNPPMVGKNAEADDATKAWEKFDQTIANAKATISGTGAEVRYLEAQIDAVTTLMKDLATAGVKPTDEAMQFLSSTVKQLNVDLENAKKGAALAADWKAFADETTAANMMAEAFGSTLVDLQGEAQRLQSVIKNLIADGIDPHDEALQALIERLGEVQDAIDSETAAMQFQQQVAGDLAQALFASFGGGLGPFARMKAKQNYLEATENGIRAVLAALTGFGALHAGKYAAAAAQHAALGAAWSALASTVGGPSGSAPTVSSSGSNPGSGLGTARQSSGSSSRNAQQPTPITEIHFVGPGFDALNPTVQKVVRGAEQQAIERAGNVRVRVVRSNS